MAPVEPAPGSRDAANAGQARPRSRWAPSPLTFEVTAIVSAAATTVFALWVAGRWGGAEATLVFVNATSFLAPLAAAGACAWRAGTEHRAARLAWFLLAAACASWAVGQAAWATYVLAHDYATPPGPGLADAGYLGMVPLACAGLLLLIGGPARGTGRARILLDAAVAATSMVFIGWGAVLRDLVGAPVGAPIPVKDLIYYAYPTGDVLLATLAFILMARSRRGDRATLALLGAGFVATATADTLYFAQTLKGIFEDGTMVHIGWIAGFLLIACGALRVSTQAPMTAGRPTMTATAWSYAPFALAILAAVESVREHGFLEAFLFWTALVTIALVVARQFVTLAENLALTRQVEATLAELRDAEAGRRVMLTSIAHDVASPLTPVRLQVRLLENDHANLSESQTKAVRTIARNVEQVTRLVGDLKDVSTLDSGHLRLERAAMDPADVVQGVVHAVQPQAAAKGVTLSCQAPAGLRIHADAARLHQVVLNLVANAVKFTPAGGRVEVVLAAEDGSCRLDVTDTGRGLSPEEVARLFRPFSQVHNRASQDPAERGTGLGLYICKGIVEAHGGTVACASPGPGQGSTFTARLPMA